MPSLPVSTLPAKLACLTDRNRRSPYGKGSSERVGGGDGSKGATYLPTFDTGKHDYHYYSGQESL